MSLQGFLCSRRGFRLALWVSGAQTPVNAGADDASMAPGLDRWPWSTCTGALTLLFLWSTIDYCMHFDYTRLTITLTISLSTVQFIVINTPSPTTRSFSSFASESQQTDLKKRDRQGGLSSHFGCQFIFHSSVYCSILDLKRKQCSRQLSSGFYCAVSLPCITASACMTETLEYPLTVFTYLLQTRSAQ